jgi:alpha-tubulin suppressor-like RCC1 family protein
MLAWGDNTYGQLCDGSALERLVPTAVPLPNVSGVSGGWMHTAIALADGSMRTCGGNTGGQLGTGNLVASASPVQPQGLTSGVKAVFAGGEHTLVLMNDGTARSFGDNSSGTLGSGNKVSSMIPVMVVQPSGIRWMSAGYNHSLAVKSDGMLYAFGFNDYGRLGDGTTTSRSTGVPMLGGVK